MTTPDSRSARGGRASRSRLKRPRPARTDPIRSWSQLFEPVPAPARPAGTTDQTPPGVREAIDLGYRVIQDYIRQGRDLARDGPGTAAPGEASGESFEGLTERLLRDALLWWGQLARMLPDAEAAAAPRAGASAPGWRVVLETSQRASVELDLRAMVAPGALGVHPLRAPEPEAPPITDVSVRDDPERGGRIELRIPDDQPPGVYSGLLVELPAGEPRGSVTVRVGHGA